MRTHKRLLVPLDGSVTAESVLPEVEKLATAAEVEICLIRVAYSHFNGLRVNPLAHQAEIVREAEQYLEKIKDRLERKGFIVESWVWYGPDPAKEILNHIEFFGTDLVVMATHGRGGLKRLLMGSVAEKVAHHTLKPVMLVGARRDNLKAFAEGSGGCPPEQEYQECPMGFGGVRSV
jgi:nucleotide-binding universal stress UspA family protein